MELEKGFMEYLLRVPVGKVHVFQIGSDIVLLKKQKELHQTVYLYFRVFYKHLQIK